MHASRRLLMALALLLTLAATFLATPQRTQAATGRCGHDWFFYSDATHKTEVGFEEYDCNCVHSFWGVRTAYSTIESLGC